MRVSSHFLDHRGKIIQVRPLDPTVRGHIDQPRVNILENQAIYFILLEQPLIQLYPLTDIPTDPGIFSDFPLLVSHRHAVQHDLLKTDYARSVQPDREVDDIQLPAIRLSEKLPDLLLVILMHIRQIGFLANVYIRDDGILRIRIQDVFIYIIIPKNDVTYFIYKLRLQVKFLQL